MNDNIYIITTTEEEYGYELLAKKIYFKTEEEAKAYCIKHNKDYDVEELKLEVFKDTDKYLQKEITDLSEIKSLTILDENTVEFEGIHDYIEVTEYTTQSFKYNGTSYNNYYECLEDCRLYLFLSDDEGFPHNFKKGDIFIMNLGKDTFYKVGD